MKGEIDGDARAVRDALEALEFRCARRAAEWALGHFGDGHAARRGVLALSTEKVRREVRVLCVGARRRRCQEPRTQECVRANVDVCTYASDHSSRV